MIKISNKEIADVVKFSDTKVIFAEKVLMGDLASTKASFFVLDFESGEKEAVTTGVYKLKKFGRSYEKICDKITDFVNCDAIILKDKSVLVMFEGGEAGLFDSDGEMLWNKKLLFNDIPVTSLAYDGEYIWCVCSGEDCVIRYNTDNFNIDIRIGGKEQNTFRSPHFASADDEYIYICCADKIRKISKEDLTVSDEEGIYEVPRRYYRLGRFSILCRYDGAYIDKDE